MFTLFFFNNAIIQNLNFGIFKYTKNVISIFLNLGVVSVLLKIMTKGNKYVYMHNIKYIIYYFYLFIPILRNKFDKTRRISIIF